MSFEYIMKAADAVGISFPVKLAKAAVRKYGKRKDHLNVEDCVKIMQRREERKNVKSAPSKRRWSIYNWNNSDMNLCIAFVFLFIVFFYTSNLKKGNQTLSPFKSIVHIT